MGSQKLGDQDEIGGTYIGAIGYPGKEFALPQGKQLLIDGNYLKFFFASLYLICVFARFASLCTFYKIPVIYFIYIYFITYLGYDSSKHKRFFKEKERPFEKSSCSRSGCRESNRQLYRTR
jgi:hypothetical protein